MLLPAHPTPLYDSLFHLLLFVALLRLAKRGRPGTAGWLFFWATAVFNVALEFIRINPAVGFGLTLSQWT